MKFKRNSDKQLVIRSLLLHANGDELLAEQAVDNNPCLETAILFVLCKKGDLKACNMLTGYNYG